MMPSPQEQTTQTANSAQQNAPMEVNSSQYSSCETLDSHRSSEYDDEANGSDEKGKRSRRISSENSDYIAKERVTKAAPPKPAYNPMQFIAQKPSNLFQTAQAQLKKAEEVKKTKETTVREEPEEWQNVNTPEILRIELVHLTKFPSFSTFSTELRQLEIIEKETSRAHNRSCG